MELNTLHLPQDLLSAHDDTSKIQASLFRSVVGKLWWIAASLEKLSNSMPSLLQKTQHQLIICILYLPSRTLKGRARGSG